MLNVGETQGSILMNTRQVVKENSKWCKQDHVYKITNRKKSVVNRWCNDLLFCKKICTSHVMVWLGLMEYLYKKYLDINIVCVIQMYKHRVT